MSSEKKSIFSTITRPALGQYACCLIKKAKFNFTYHLQLKASQYFFSGPFFVKLNIPKFNTYDDKLMVTGLNNILSVNPAFQHLNRSILIESPDLEFCQDVGGSLVTGILQSRQGQAHHARWKLQ